MIDLKKYRKNKRLDQKSLSELTGIDQSIISKYENGISRSFQITERLIQSIPDLKDYIVEEEEISMASEALPQYGYSGSGMMRIIEEQSLAIRELTSTNKQLTEMLNECLTRKHRKDHVLNN